MSARRQAEVERTYELEGPLPDLAVVDGVATVARLDDEHLDATYHDTDDLRLAAARTTLRRRSGGRDAGWHLKLPGDGRAREEVHAPPHGDGPPAELVALVEEVCAGRPLAPVVRLRTTRAVHQLLDPDGGVLAEVADDDVTSVLLPDGPEQRWREVEVELVRGSDALLDAVEAVLVAAGARPAATPSKLRRALGPRLPG